MAEDDKPERVKDLLKRGTLEEHQPASADFGERVMRRHLRRPAGNSERLWRKVDGSDPWDLPEPPKPDKQRGVWAAGRFVRMDQAEAKKESEASSHIPDWARKQAEQPRQAKASADPPQPQAQPKPEPSKAKPEDKIKEVIARRQAEADEQARAAAVARAAQAAQTSSAPEPDAAPVPQIPVGSRKASVSRGGRIRTQHGGSFDPSAAPAAPSSEPDVQHRYAAGRAPPPPRAKPKDLPIEMRRPPKIDPNAPSAPEAPVQHRYAAGRAPPPPRAKPKDLPVEMRRPPRIDPNAPAGPEAPVEHRYAAGRAPPPPRAKAKDLPIEQRSPPRIGPDGQPMPPSSPPQAAAPASSPAPGTPESLPRPPAPAPQVPAAPSTAGNSGSLDDLFGLANEGPMRIGRRARKKAVAEPEASPKPPGSDEG